MHANRDHNHILAPLEKPIYVIKMGWPRWLLHSRKRWLLELRMACLETVRRIDEYMAKQSMHGPTKPRRGTGRQTWYRGR